MSAGTGIVLTSDGLILTNNHVIEGSTEITVTVPSTGETYEATVVGTDARSDIAVIELDADIVSGDSGGPLLEDKGDVVGINTAASDSNTMPVAAIQGSDITAYAIHIDHAMEIVDTILAGEETDTVTIGYPAFLGVQLATGETGMPGGRYGDNGQGGTGQGAVIAGAIQDAPAAEAGLQAGDTVIAIEDTTITSGDDLSEALEAYEPGDEVTITWTDTSGQSHTATVTLTESPAD
jgi:S1-C subfamily serine protease